LAHDSGLAHIRLASLVDIREDLPGSPLRGLTRADSTSRRLNEPERAVLADGAELVG
jgi:hypothetical protein